MEDLERIDVEGLHKRKERIKQLKKDLVALFESGDISIKLAYNNDDKYDFNGKGDLIVIIDGSEVYRQPEFIDWLNPGNIDRVD